ncbi:phage portal protein [Clostridium perfringens]|uniref:phage portal protein n=1 Tax=Clostridium perfringens TaxID=1502 RepID=UPI00399CDDB8
MELSKIQKIISDDSDRRENILKAKKYYDNESDIKEAGILPVEKDPLRNADNRISHNFHQIMVDEKASYMFTYPVLFNVDNNKEINIKVGEVLGDDFESVSQSLCIEASNAGVGWMYYWINDRDKTFNYALVPTEQIIPVFKKNFKRELKELYRYYNDIDESNKNIVIFEHWTDTEVTIYVLEGSITSVGKIIESKNIKHKLKTIPFIPFFNNKNGTSDLIKYKDLIDLYDRVMSGFANDLEDIQQIIYILENYGGADLSEFTSNLRKFKAIKVNQSGSPAKGDVRTLQIEIPVEARKVILDILKKQIYESGQGLQQDTENFGNASGVALKFFYRKLELKAGFTETEFKKGFGVLVRAILRYLKKDDKVKITQTYTRNMISNDLENSQIAKNSVGIIPEEIIIRNHPWVEDPDEALELLRKEEKENEVDPYDENNKAKGNEVDE